MKVVKFEELIVNGI